MKKSMLLAALVGVALTSCTKDESFAPAEQAISFEVGTYKASTRVSDYTTTKSFGAFAYYAEDNGVAAPVVFMDNVEVEWETGTGKGQWAPTPNAYYWPTIGSVDFICYAPYGATYKPTISSSGTNTWDKLTWEGYTVEDTYPNQTDLLYGNKAENYTENGANNGFEGVPTLFNHALAKLNFKVKAATLTGTDISWNIAIKNITISGIYNKGNVTLETTNENSAAKTLTWTKPSPAAVWTINGTTTMAPKTWEVSTVSDLYDEDADELTGQLLTTAEVDYEGAKDFYVLPQALEDGKQQVTVEYEITTTNGSATYKKEYSNTVDFYDIVDGLKNWEMGKNITYVLNISPNGNIILFAPSVEDWAAVSGGTALITPGL